MNLIIKDRQKGKTTGLIYASEATGYPIITLTQAGVDCIYDIAADLGCKIPKPMTVDEFKNGRSCGQKNDNILVDDVNLILGAALNEYFGCNVECATMSYLD